jgi:hypothetical protein
VKFFTDIEDNRILSENVKDGYYKVSIDEVRNSRLNSKYWKMLEYTFNNLPEKANLGVTWYGVELFNIDIPNKNKLHTFFKEVYGVQSTSFSDMDEQEFREYYSKVLDMCFKLLGDRGKEVLGGLVGFA